LNITGAFGFLDTLSGLPFFSRYRVDAVSPVDDLISEWLASSYTVSRMVYDFDTIIDRPPTSSSKWSYAKKMTGYDDVLSIWISDTILTAPTRKRHYPGALVLLSTPSTSSSIH
jgi:hypothetical protein